MNRFLKLGNKDTFRFKQGQAFFAIILVSISILFVGYFSKTTIAASDSGLATVFHVYVDDKYIGKVDDRSVVNDVVEAKLSTETEESIELIIDENITYIVEKAFNPRYQNERVVNKLNDMLTVKVEAYELRIGDEVLGYFSGEDQASEVIMKYQMTYVSNDDIEKLQLNDQKITFKETLYIENINIKEDPKSLSVGESQLIDVKLASDVEISELRVEPEEVITVKEGLTLLKKGTLEEEKHTISEGEVLGSIASKYDLTTKELLKLNPSIKDETLLQIGQELNVTAIKPFVDVVVIEEEMVEEKITHETEIIESEEMYKGEQKVTQKGKNGKKQVHYKVEKTNGSITDREVLDEKVIKKPTKKIIVKGTKVIPSRGSGVLTWPTNGGYISSNYGYRWGRLHKGIDIARPSNRTIKAADHGVVTFARYDGGFGNKVIINHNNGMKTLYAHLSSINVRVGQTIEKGSQIGIMGSTGNSTGVHLHFEVHQNGSVQNPLRFY